MVVVWPHGYPNMAQMSEPSREEQIPLVHVEGCPFTDSVNLYVKTAVINLTGDFSSESSNISTGQITCWSQG